MNRSRERKRKDEERKIELEPLKANVGKKANLQNTIDVEVNEINEMRDIFNKITATKKQRVHIHTYQENVYV